MRRWMWLVVWTACLAPAGAAVAQPATQPGAAADGRAKDLAKEWAKKGRERFDQGHYAGAVEALREAEKHYPAATIVKLRGDAHVKLGQLLEARKAYQQVAGETLAADAAPPLVAAQQGAKAALADLEAKIPTIEITLPSGAKGATVKLDGAKVAAAELSRPIAADPGKHLLLLEVPGAESRIREVQLAEGAHERVTFGQGVPGAGDGQAAVRPPGDTGRSWVGPGIAFGAGGAALVLGAVMGALTVTKMDEVRKTCGEGLVCPDAYRDEVDGARTLGHVSTAGFIAAGVGAAVGVVLVVLPRKKAPAAVGLSLGPGFAGVKGVW